MIFQVIYLTNIFWSFLLRYVFFKLINYLTNIGSTCQDITIYDIIIRCKNKHPPLPKNDLGGIQKKSTYSKFF